MLWFADAVNSASEGPWGDAIMYELLPEVERRFRGIGEGWARFTYGCSTGGWVSLAVQVFYPVRQGVHFRLLSALLAGRLTQCGMSN